jgi:uncharacterized protein
VRIATTIWSSLLVLVALMAPLGAQQAGDPRALPEFPALTGHVVDEADILPVAMRAELDAKLAALQGKSTDALVVVTLKSLRGRAIEDYGVALGRYWQIGHAVKNNGVVLLVAPNERKVRIEVGYGLEGVLTDAVTKLIIENSILPRFRTGDVPSGVMRGVDDIIAVLTGDTEEWKQRARPVARSEGLGVQVVKFVAVLFFAGVAIVFFGAWAFMTLGLLVSFGRRIGLLPHKKDRTERWRWLNVFDSPRLPRLEGFSTPSWERASYSGSSGSSGSLESSSPSDGGSFGGGGASGNW